MFLRISFIYLFLAGIIISIEIVLFLQIVKLYDSGISDLFMLIGFLLNKPMAIFLICLISSFIIIVLIKILKFFVFSNL